MHTDRRTSTRSRSLCQLGARQSAAFVTLLLATACTLDLATDGLQDDLEDSLEELGSLEICDGQTLEELIDATTISEECKEEVSDYLPEPESDFEGRLVVLGTTEGTDGSLSIFVHGVDEGGIALDEATLAALELRIEEAGETRTLLEGEFSIRQGAAIEGDLLSIGFVNDYSGSMFDSDLRTTAEIEEGLLSVLPDIVEGEVTQFSTEVSTKQSFTNDRELLLEAVAYDPDFERDLTALYDGMGQGLSRLVERPRPLRLLVVATDGSENASEMTTKAQLLDTIASENVCVLMLGSLFSDPSELSEFASPCGAYFYTRGYGDLKAAVGAYVDSLGALTEVEIDAESRGSGSIELRLDGLRVSVE